MTPDALTVRALEVRYGTTEAVRGIDLDVGAGEIVAVIGPSGCGKSTLLRAIAGLEPVHAGSVRWGDDDLTHVEVHRRGFGLMFQDHALFPHRDVATNVAFGLRMQHVAPRERETRVHEALEMVGLAGFGTRRTDELSGGEAQRVALARALAPRPRLVMLDEPLGSLDRALRERLAVDIRSTVRALGVAALHVTHDQDEAFTVADRVAVMQRGQLIRVDAPPALWRDPRHESVARFLGHHDVLTAADARLLGIDVAPGAGVVLRAGALRLDERGPITATVVETRFSTSTVWTDVLVEGIAARLRVPAAHGSPAATAALACVPGARVRLAVDHAHAAPVALDR